MELGNGLVGVTGERRRQILVLVLFGLHLVVVSLLVVNADGVEAVTRHERDAATSSTRHPTSTTRKPATTTKQQTSTSKPSKIPTSTTKRQTSTSKTPTSTTKRQTSTTKHHISVQTTTKANASEISPPSKVTKRPGQPKKHASISERSKTYKFSETQMLMLELLLRIKKKLDRMDVRIDWDEDMNPDILEDLSYAGYGSYEFYTKCDRDGAARRILDWAVKLRDKLADERERIKNKSSTKKPSMRTTSEGPGKGSTTQKWSKTTTTSKQPGTTAKDRRNHLTSATVAKNHFKFNSTTKIIIETLTHSMSSTSNGTHSSTSSSSQSWRRELLTNEQKEVVRQVMEMKSRLPKQTPSGLGRQLTRSRPMSAGHKVEMGADMFEKMIQTSHAYLELSERDAKVEERLDAKQRVWLGELYNRVEKNLRNSSKFESEEKMQSFIKNMLDVNSIFVKLKQEYSSSHSESNESHGTSSSSTITESIPGNSRSADDLEEGSDSDSGAETWSGASDSDAAASSQSGQLGDDKDDPEDDS